MILFTPSCNEFMKGRSNYKGSKLWKLKMLLHGKKQMSTSDIFVRFAFFVKVQYKGADFTYIFVKWRQCSNKDEMFLINNVKKLWLKLYH